MACYLAGENTASNLVELGTALIDTGGDIAVAVIQDNQNNVQSQAEQQALDSALFRMENFMNPGATNGKNNNTLLIVGGVSAAILLLGVVVITARR